MSRRRARITFVTGMITCITAAGCAKTLAFSTATKFALDVSQQADKKVDVSLGYDRAEVAVIPAAKDVDAGPDTDAYSVLGTFFVHYDSPFDQNDPLRLNQFFATGEAARVAAQSERFQTYFGHSAGVIEANRANDTKSFENNVNKLRDLAK